MKKFAYALMVCLFVSLIDAKAQQADQSGQNPASSRQSKFKNLLDSSDAIITTERYEIEGYKNGDLRAFASVGWANDESKKIYAASLADVYVDFERLDALRNDLEKVIQKIERAGSENKLTSVSYASPEQIAVNYYTFRDDGGNLLRSVYLKCGVYFSQDKTTAKIREFSNLLIRIREKLISLGAKSQGEVSKK